ncbi:MAG: toll/interleukin-1 receptor domain-containing protein [bacterium]
MATLRKYYEKDFDTCTRMHIRLPFNSEQVEGAVLYDFVSFTSFLALFVEGNDRDSDYFQKLLSSITHGTTQVNLDHKVTLPSAKSNPAQIFVENKKDFEILAKFHGDTEWISTKNIPATTRIFIYSMSNLTNEEIIKLKGYGKRYGHELQFRDNKFVEERNRFEVPLAFISHDSRDQEQVAKSIAIGLQRLLCPVWYDEFSLKLGDNLRDSIEKGLKECKKCILVLSPNFLSNKGWTKTEFDSIFTRQLIEEKKLILPVWHKVSKVKVYNYSPSLANIRAADWEKLGQEEVCRLLYNEIVQI